MNRINLDEDGYNRRGGTLFTAWDSALNGMSLLGTVMVKKCPMDIRG